MSFERQPTFKGLGINVNLLRYMAFDVWAICDDNNNDNMK